MQKFQHISTATQQAVDYIKKRQSGKEKSLKVSHWKFNKSLLDGIPWGRIITIGGTSGAGKSTLMEQWKRDLVELNIDQPLEILAFEYEMLQMDTVIRSIAAKTKVSSAHIQSAEGNTVTDEEIDTYIKTAESLAEYPIYYVDESGTVADMRNTIVNFVLQRDLKEREVSLVITIDHITLTKGRDSDMEKKVIDELYKMLLDMKRLLMAQGIRCLFICLSQLNRDIQSVERKKPAYHYPTSNDLFGASSIYQGSDYVLITHNPSTISGIQSYGPPCGDKYPEGLPLYCNKTGRAMIYWHLIKNRFGKLAVMIMRENFLESKIEDMETE